MRKSILTTLLVILLAFSLLASCAKKTETPPAASPPAATTPPAPEPSPDAEGDAPDPAPEPEYGPDGIAFADGKLTERFTLKIVKPTQFNEAIFADLEGFFDEVGIDVEYIGALPQNVSLAQAVQTGIVDVFGSGHTTNIVLARQAGVNLKVVLAGTEDSAQFNQTHMTWFVREDSPIQSIADLKGKLIGTSGLGGCAELWQDVLLGRNGLTPADVEVTVIAQEPAIEQALRQGNLDVAILHGPNNVIADA
ncbi:MAG: ABC transporter substrate-binding protein, partial [Oscillospiraceae bacterium]|nr:ABC transporter substrate-binding protein [Oscillospiraceae bacterium]